MKKALVLLVVAAFAATVCVSVASAKMPSVVKYDTKLGTVTFDHGAHKSQGCKTCHHKGLSAGTCKDCHGVDDAAPSAKDAFHKQCKGCHKEMDKGPTKCRECHVK